MYGEHLVIYVGGGARDISPSAQSFRHVPGFVLPVRRRPPPRDLSPFPLLTLFQGERDDDEGGSVVERLLSAVGRLNPPKLEAGTQTDLDRTATLGPSAAAHPGRVARALIPCVSRLRGADAMLERVQASFDARAQQERLQPGRSLEERMLRYQRQCDERARNEIEREVRGAPPARVVVGCAAAADR